MLKLKQIFPALLSIALLPATLSAEIITLNLEQDLTNGADGPAMPLVLTVTNGDSGSSDIPDSLWNYQPHVVGPVGGVGFMDEFFIKVASVAAGGTSLSGSLFSPFVSGNTQVFPGIVDPLSYADDTTGAPQNGFIADTILWSAMSGTASPDNNTPYFDLGISLWWDDVDSTGSVTANDQIHVLGMVYSEDPTDTVAFKTANQLTEIAGIVPIPEPSSLALLGICIAGFAFLRQRR